MSMDEIDRDNLEALQRYWVGVTPPPLRHIIVPHYPYSRRAKRRVLRLFYHFIVEGKDALSALVSTQLTVVSDEDTTKFAFKRQSLLRLKNPGNHHRYQDRVSITRTKPLGSGVNRLKRSRRRA